MARPNRLKEVEKEYGEPLNVVILRLLNIHKSIPSVASIIGISEKNLFLWVQRNGIKKDVIWTVNSNSETGGHREA